MHEQRATPMPAPHGAHPDGDIPPAPAAISGATTGDVPGLVDHLFRHTYGEVVAALARVFGVRHLELVEEVVQEALLKALHTWPRRGIPENPRGWLYTAARNAALDALRRERSLRDKRDELTRALGTLAEPSIPGPEDAPDPLDARIEDDQLRMIFACCHPMLSREAQVALTLKALCGFGVPEIARAFLAPEPTIAQRLLRAKKTLRERAVALDVPPPTELPARLGAVHDVLYLLFNEGYSASAGDDLVRHELIAEALRLTALVARHPSGDTPATHALLALMLLQASRLPARTDDAGDLIPLEEQDRTRWDARLVGRGMRELVCSARGPEMTPYHIQAAIAACHAAAPSSAATDWPRILTYYDDLLRLAPSPVVVLNRAVALAEVRGPAVALAEVRRLANERGAASLATYHLLPATEATLLERLGECAAAREAYARALSLAPTEPERRYLRRRIVRCEEQG